MVTLIRAWSFRSNLPMPKSRGVNPGLAVLHRPRRSTSAKTLRRPTRLQPSPPGILAGTPPSPSPCQEAHPPARNGGQTSPSAARGGRVQAGRIRRPRSALMRGNPSTHELGGSCAWRARRRRGASGQRTPSDRRDPWSRRSSHPLAEPFAAARCASPRAEIPSPCSRT